MERVERQRKRSHVRVQDGQRYRQATASERVREHKPEITRSLWSATFDKEINKSYDSIKTMGIVSELDLPYNNRQGCGQKEELPTDEQGRNFTLSGPR